VEGHLGAHSVAASQVLSATGSNISYLVVFVRSIRCSCGTIWLTLLIGITCMEKARLVKGNDDDNEHQFWVHFLIITLFYSFFAIKYCLTFVLHILCFYSYFSCFII
jgi:hypothetical protein